MVFVTFVLIFAIGSSSPPMKLRELPGYQPSELSQPNDIDAEFLRLKTTFCNVKTKVLVTHALNLNNEYTHLTTVFNLLPVNYTMYVLKTAS